MKIILSFIYVPPFSHLYFVFDKGSFYLRLASWNKETFSPLKLSDTDVVKMSGLLQKVVKLWKALVKFDFSFIIYLKIILLIDIGSMILWIIYALLSILIFYQFVLLLHVWYFCIYRAGYQRRRHRLRRSMTHGVFFI